MTMAECGVDASCLPSVAERPVAVSRRLPGTARPREDVLREVQDATAKWRENLPEVLWQFWAPDPDVYCRWRVQLDCGCVTELLTVGDQQLPSDARWLDRGNKAWLPAGQLLCPHDDSPPGPYRGIVDWSERREVEFPADPVEPLHGIDAETWALIRRDEPHSAAFWTVTLSCGHVDEAVAPDLDWTPADGPRRVSADRQRDMTAEFEQFWTTNPDNRDEQDREHTRRILAAGWPIPRPERQCHTCRSARYIVGYQRTGWLVRRKPKPKPPGPRPPSRAALERRLRETLNEADRLRQQLARLDQQAASSATSSSS